MTFELGCQPGPGRPKGSLAGRAQAILTLDTMLARAGNQQKLDAALQEYFDENPIRFFKQLIMPLIPQNVRLELAQQGVTPWGSLRDMCRTPANSLSTAKVIDVSESSAPAGDSERPSA